MDDDEDIESLRLAALKSIQNKKEHVFKSGVSHPSEFFVERPIHYLNTRIAHTDINQQFSTLSESNLIKDSRSIYPSEFTTFGVASHTTASNNVQLSPRSAAFVSQNNDILMRRKHGGRSSRSISPDYQSLVDDRSGSATPSGYTPSSINFDSYTTAKRRTRSPVSRKSPRPLTLRAKSKSPFGRHRSPIPVYYRRSKTRSPIIRESQRSRSPTTHTNRRGNSPRNYSRNFRRSVSPARRQDKPLNRTPLQNELRRRRSKSRSPNRKYNINILGRDTKRRSSDQKKINNKWNRSNRGRTNQRPNSPIRQNRRTSSKSPQPMRPKESCEKVANKASINIIETEKCSLPTNKMDTTESDQLEHSDITQKSTDQEMDAELVVSKDIYKSNSEDDENSNDDDDGIDLFASEESESENEGRFKLNSRKNERQVTSKAVPFSKLATIGSPTAEIKELDEFNERANISRNEHSARNKDRSNTSIRTNSFRKESNRRFNSRKTTTAEEKDREYDKNRSVYKSSKVKDHESNNAMNKDRKPVMFKSTFQTVETETKHKPTEIGKYYTKYRMETNCV